MVSQVLTISLNMLVRLLNSADGDWLCSGRRKAIRPSAPIRVVSDEDCGFAERKRVKLLDFL